MIDYKRRVTQAKIFTRLEELNNFLRLLKDDQIIRDIQIITDEHSHYYFVTYTIKEREIG